MELHWVVAAFMGSSLLLSSLQICIHGFGNCWYHLLLPSSRWQTVQNKCNWIPQPLQRSTQSIYINISDTNNIIGGYSIMVLPAQQRVTAVTWIRWTRLLDHSLKCYQTKLIPLDTPFLLTYPSCGILSLTILWIVLRMLPLSINWSPFFIKPRM